MAWAKYCVLVVFIIQSQVIWAQIFQGNGNMRNSPLLSLKDHFAISQQSLNNNKGSIVISRKSCNTPTNENSGGQCQKNPIDGIALPLSLQQSQQAQQLAKLQLQQQSQNIHQPSEQNQQQSQQIQQQPQQILQQPKPTQQTSQQNQPQSHQIQQQPQLIQQQLQQQKQLNQPQSQQIQQQQSITQQKQPQIQQQPQLIQQQPQKNQQQPQQNQQQPKQDHQQPQQIQHQVQEIQQLHQQPQLIQQQQQLNQQQPQQIQHQLQEIQQLQTQVQHLQPGIQPQQQIQLQKQIQPQQQIPQQQQIQPQPQIQPQQQIQQQPQIQPQSQIQPQPHIQLQEQIQRPQQIHQQISKSQYASPKQIITIPYTKIIQSSNSAPLILSSQSNNIAQNEQDGGKIQNQTPLLVSKQPPMCANNQQALMIDRPQITLSTLQLLNELASQSHSNAVLPKDVIAFVQRQQPLIQNLESNSQTQPSCQLQEFTSLQSQPIVATMQNPPLVSSQNQQLAFSQKQPSTLPQYQTIRVSPQNQQSLLSAFLLSQQNEGLGSSQQYESVPQSSPVNAITSQYSDQASKVSSLKMMLPLLFNLLKEKEKGCGCQNCNCRCPNNDYDFRSPAEPQYYNLANLLSYGQPNEGTPDNVDSNESLPPWIQRSLRQRKHYRKRKNNSAESSEDYSESLEDDAED